MGKLRLGEVEAELGPEAIKSGVFKGGTWVVSPGTIRFTGLKLGATGQVGGYCVRAGGQALEKPQDYLQGRRKERAA